jgi:hypothetical protein
MFGQWQAIGRPKRYFSRDVGLMASVARANISIHPQGVTITSGNYHASLSHNEWWLASSTSLEQVVHLPLQKKCDRMSFALGLVVRSKRIEDNHVIWNEAVRAINGITEPKGDIIVDWGPEVQENPTQLIKSSPGMIDAFLKTIGNGNIHGLKMFEALLPFFSLFDFEADTPSAILAGVSKAVMKTTDRYVQRNILNTKISRHIPQDVKIAVAHRDGGRCTHRLNNGTRCIREDKMHFDHRWIPFHLGGPQDPWNMCLLCEDHNWSKSGNWFWE